MDFKKNIFILLAVVLCAAVTLQLIRSEYPIRITGNIKNIYAINSESKSTYLDKDIIGTIDQEKYLVIIDEDDKASVGISFQVLSTLKYLKKNYDVRNVYEYNDNPQGYKAVFFTSELLSKLPSIEDTVNYVYSGGRVFFAMRPLHDGAFYEIYRKLGINEAGSVITANGILLKSNVLIKSEGLKAEGDYVTNSTMGVKLSEECNVHAVSNEGVPLLWDINFGMGKFMVFNGTMLIEKVNRGVIAGALSILVDDFIYPVMNSKVFFIDDFPCPFGDIKDPDIYKDYGRNVRGFFKEIWWPDIRKSIYLYDIKITAAMIESYNDLVEPPFTIGEGDSRKNLIVYGRELLKCGSELGIHGYNHQSLAEDNDYGYNRWTSEENMVASLEKVITFASDVYPEYKLCNYVPPSNVLCPKGRSALKKGMPHLNSISSVYLDGFATNLYVQEFEVSNDGIIEFPRLTAGYEKGEQTQWIISNGITSLGVFSHFIHPDDILDPERSNNKSWGQLYSEFCDIMGDIKKDFSWLRSMTVSEAVKDFKSYNMVKPYVEHKQDMVNVYCDNFVDGVYYIFRTQKEINRFVDCIGKEIDKGVYLVYSDKPVFSIETR